MILITGANGLIGRALVAQYLTAETPLRLQVRDRAKLQKLFPDIEKQKQIQVVELDLGEASEADCVALSAACKTIIHTAALVHQPQAKPQEYERLNFEASAKLFQAAKKNAVKQIVFISTIAVYGSGSLRNVSEEHKPAPDTPYGMSKLKCETYLRHELSAPLIMIFRPALVFGEGDRGNMLSLLKQIKSGKYFHIDGGQALKSLIYADDLAKAIKVSLEKQKSDEGCYQTFNIANPQPISMYELSESINLLLRRKKRMLSFPASLMRMAASIGVRLLGSRCPLTPDRLDKLTQSTYVAVDKLQNELGALSFTPLKQSLQAEIDWATKEKLL
ncbi:MAG: NAD-dependent epimerase/dehydratase family protein [Candidatus Obscuribacterales bacterium]|nr:NAD-dependent epimerase/dehydratase family protein [Candidatus Obscuribacterales bacterium]